MMMGIATRSKCLFLICVTVVGLCYVPYFKFTRSPKLTKQNHSPDKQIARKPHFIDTNVTKQKSLPTIKQSREEGIAWKSHFIYQPPKHLKLVSLTYNCPSCIELCPNASEGISETCQGSACLCNKLSPILTFSTHTDNSEHSEDFMLEAEKESLQTQHITDLKSLPSLTKTQVKMLRSEQTHKIGDKIRIIVTLVNGYGKQLLRGGDDIRVSMAENMMSNFIVGIVHDYKNGTYLITIPVLWEGTNVITITLNYFQEERAAIFRWYRQFGVLFYHYGQFKSNKTEQYTLCGISPRINGYKEICNMSLYNDGDPWYCGKPPSKQLECNDIIKSFDHRFIDIAVTEAEKVLFRRECTDRNRTLPWIHINTKGGEYNRDQLPYCTQVNPTETWKTDEPSGYFYKKNYYSTRCRWRSSRPKIIQCLKNTTLILHGDSTVLQWITLLKKLSKCIVNKNYTGGKWYEEMVCEKKDLRFKMKFAPHNMPFSCFLNRHHKVAPATKSIETSLNEIPSTGRTIFVVHFGQHFTRQHYNVFRYKILRLKSSLQKALSRNKDLTILIKGPHMCTCMKWVPSVNDALLPHLITMLIAELAEFSDRVIYLNYYDMSVAAQNKAIHPGEKFVRDMVETMLFYACFSSNRGSQPPKQ